MVYANSVVELSSLDRAVETLLQQLKQQQQQQQQQCSWPAPLSVWRRVADATASIPSTITIESSHQLRMLLAVQLADWFQQAEDVDRRGFGSADRPRESVAYGESRIQWEPGKTGLSFRAEAFDTFIQVLALLGDADVATAAKIGHTLLRQRLVKSKCRHKRVTSGLAKM
eukprot:COSAG01_NODE_6554_length_3611_cov_1.222665_3_plen_170_part_00